MNKPGWKTSEFWLTLVPVVSGLLLAFGVIKPGDAHTFDGEMTNSVTAAAALLASAWKVGHYIQSRTTVKSSS